MKISIQQLVTTCLLLSLWSSVASASETESKCTKAEDVKAAQGAHAAAKAFFRKEKYDQALKQWELAYGFDCTAHRLLLNIASSHENAGRLGKAIEALQLYVTRDKKGATPELDKRIANLKERLAKESAATSPPPKKDKAEMSKPSGASADIPPGDATGPGAGPWILVGTGAASAVAGGVFMALAASRFDTARGFCTPNVPCADPNFTEAETNNSDGKLFNGIGIGALGAGLAAVGGGLTWYLLHEDAPESKDSGFRLSPLVNQTIAGATLTGRF